MPPFRIALRVVPGVLALAELALLVALLHVPIGHAMRARGLPRWRLRDTALVSPLALLGALLFLASVNHAMARLAFDVAQGRVQVGHALLSAGMAAVGLLMAGFGARAIGKLY